MNEAEEDEAGRRKLLNAGSGALHGNRLPETFKAPDWQEVTIDVDPGTRPDQVGSLTDMRAFFADGSFDVVWSSHSVEHLFVFDLEAALAEFRRVLKPDGFALVTCPDIESVAQAVLDHGLDHVAYISPAGPITLHDILYGHTASIAGGATAMAHRTGLTAARLGQLAIAAGFPEAMVGRGTHYDLWAVLRMPETDLALAQRWLASSDAAFLFEPEPPVSMGGSLGA